MANPYLIAYIQRFLHGDDLLRVAQSSRLSREIAHVFVSDVQIFKYIRGPPPMDRPDDDPEWGYFDDRALAELIRLRGRSLIAQQSNI